MNILEQLRLLRQKYGCLPQEKLKELAEEEGCTLAELIGTASFYDFLTQEQRVQTHPIQNEYPCRRAGMMLNPPEKYMWRALAKCQADVSGVIPALRDSGLLGRGGGAFPVWKKWQTTLDAPGEVKYVVCNADEGELGTGKDRVFLERNPKAVLEGMAICARTVGAKTGYIYLRGEYSDLIPMLESEIQAAPLKGFEITLCIGQGAYVCGEETALLNSIEGRRGEPRIKPPYPGVEGLWGKPTVINNVETFGCVPIILEHGAQAFRSRGTEDYPGSKLYTVCGAVRDPGVYEMDAGTTVAQLLEAAGGAKETLRAVLVGGSSGTLLGADCMDMRMSVTGCAEYGAGLGTGSLRFIGVGESIPSILKESVAFYAKESCGICSPCRVGLARLRELLEKLEQGKAYPDDIQKIKALAEHIRENARCALAQAAVTPVLSGFKQISEVLE